MNDGSAGLTGLALMQPKIEMIAGGVVGPNRRYLPERERPATYTPSFSYYDTRTTTDVLMGDGIVYEVTRQAELPCPVAVFDLGHIKDVVLRWQADPRDRRHPEERSGPGEVV